jgi:hypothetical protein
MVGAHTQLTTLCHFQVLQAEVEKFAFAVFHTLGAACVIRWSDFACYSVKADSSAPGEILCSTATCVLVTKATMGKDC